MQYIYKVWGRYDKIFQYCFTVMILSKIQEPVKRRRHSRDVHACCTSELVWFNPVALGSPAWKLCGESPLVTWLLQFSSAMSAESLCLLWKARQDKEILSLQTAFTWCHIHLRGICVIAQFCIQLLSWHLSSDMKDYSWSSNQHSGNVPTKKPQELEQVFSGL